MPDETQTAAPSAPVQLRAFDAQAANVVAVKSHALVAAGIGAVGLYYFKSSGSKQLLTADVAAFVSDAGLKLFSVYENGFPTSAAYFTVDRANMDAHTAAGRAQDAHQPDDTTIFFAVDYDAAVRDLPAIKAYFTEVRRVLHALPTLQDGAPTYNAGVYGSGLVCRHLSEAGLVADTWLSQSRGFSGYADWKGSADIVQGVETTLLGMDVDLDTVYVSEGSGATWSVAPNA